MCACAAGAGVHAQGHVELRARLHGRHAGRRRAHDRFMMYMRCENGPDIFSALAQMVPRGLTHGRT